MRSCFQCLEQGKTREGVHGVSPGLRLCDSCYITHELLPRMRTMDADYIQQIQSLTERLNARAKTVSDQMITIAKLKETQIPGYCESCAHCDVRYLPRVHCLRGHHCEFCSIYTPRVEREEPKPKPRTRYMAAGRLSIRTAPPCLKEEL